MHLPGLPVTVYRCKPPDGTETALHWERQGELEPFQWAESGAGYALAPCPRARG